MRSNQSWCHDKPKNPLPCLVNILGLFHIFKDNQHMVGDVNITPVVLTTSKEILLVPDLGWIDHFPRTSLGTTFRLYWPLPKNISWHHIQVALTTSQELFLVPYLGSEKKWIHFNGKTNPGPPGQQVNVLATVLQQLPWSCVPMELCMFKKKIRSPAGNSNPGPQVIVLATMLLWLPWSSVGMWKSSPPGYSNPRP